MHPFASAQDALTGLKQKFLLKHPYTDPSKLKGALGWNFRTSSLPVHGLLQLVVHLQFATLVEEVDRTMVPDRV